jgi:hypothetical protein
MNRPSVLGVQVLIAIAAVLVMAGAEQAARAGYILDGASNYGLLYEGAGNNSTLAFNNSTLNGNIGVGGTASIFQGSSGTVNGLLQFASSTAQYQPSGGFTLSPSTSNPQFGVPAVSSALSFMNSLSQTLGLEPGTSTTIASGVTINASSGSLDANGNDVFTVSAINFSNGTCTINGTSNQTVVLNVAGNVGSNGLNGTILLTGGITSDEVLINYTPSTSNTATYNSSYASLSGGPTLTISTNGLTTSATFLNPTGNFSVNHSVVMGRIIGGDSTNSSFQSGANLTAPPPVPEPSALALLATAALGTAGYRWRRRTRAKG